MRKCEDHEHPFVVIAHPVFSRGLSSRVKRMA
jgi:hypothetical protein